MSTTNTTPFKFENEEVGKTFEPVDVEKDFQVRVPTLQWSGQFSTITKPVAEELVKQKYNRIKVKK